MSYRENKFSINLKILLAIILCAVVPLIVQRNSPENYFQLKMLVSLGIALVGLGQIKWKVDEGLIWVLCLFVLVVISTITSIQPSLSLMGVESIPEGLLGLGICYGLFLIGKNLGRGMEEEHPWFRRISELVLVSASVLSFIGILEFFGVMEPLSFRFGLDVSNNTNYTTIGNRNLVGTYTILMIPLSFWWTIRYRKLRGFVYSFLLVGLMVIAQTRSAYLSFLVIVLGFLYISFRNTKERKWNLALMLGIIVYLVGGVFLLTKVFQDPRILIRLQKLYQDLLQPLEESAGSDRMLIWKNTLTFAFEKPWFGFGPDTFGLVYDKYIGVHWDTFPKAHNHMLQMLVTMGVPYTLLYYGFILRIVYGLVKKHSEIALVFLVIILSYEFQGMFNISTGPNNYIYFLLLGLSMGYIMDSKR